MDCEKLISSVLKQAQSQNQWSLVPSEYTEKNETDNVKDNVDKNLRVPHWDEVKIFLDVDDEDEKEVNYDFNPTINDPPTKELRKDYGRFQNL